MKELSLKIMIKCTDWHFLMPNYKEYHRDKLMPLEVTIQIQRTYWVPTKCKDLNSDVSHVWMFRLKIHTEQPGT